MEEEPQGFEVLRRLREGSRIPVLMLTARGDDVDRIVGLEMGADDYVAKPFSQRELLARIRAVLRRAAPAPSGTFLDGDLSADWDRHLVSVSGEPVDLTDPMWFKIGINYYLKPGDDVADASDLTTLR